MTNVTLLKEGLDGLARAGEVSWFAGHFGAALLAGERLVRREDFSPEVKAGILDQMDKARATTPKLFAPLPDSEPVPDYRARLSAALRPHVEDVSISGHGAIYGAMALQAMGEAPHLATRARLDGIERLMKLALHDRDHRYYGIEDYRTATPPDNFPTYHTLDAMAAQAIAECSELFPDGYVGEYFYYFTAEKLHGVTFGHALLTLEKIGLADLARLGLRAHRKALWLNRHRPPTGQPLARIPAPEVTPFHAGYWQKQNFDDHGLKLAIATLELLERIPPAERTRVYEPATFWSPFVRAS